MKRTCATRSTSSTSRASTVSEQLGRLAPVLFFHSFSSSDRARAHASRQRQGPRRARPRVRIEIERLARGVAPAQAAAWWGDFRDGREDHRFLPGTTRRVIATTGGVRLEEETRLLGARVWRESSDVRVAPGEVAFHGRNPFASFQGRYLFEPAPGGTRVRLVADVALVRPLAWTDAAARGIVAAILRADLHGHVTQMRRDLKAR